MLTLLLACTGGTNVSTLDHPELVVAPDAIDFGEVIFGVPETQTFTVSNTGGVPMGLDTVGVAFGHVDNFMVTLGEADCATDGILQPGCAITVDVTFDPVDAGTLNASVQVTTVTTDGDDPETRGNTDLDSSVAYVQLSGSVVRDEGRVSVSPRSLDFGTVNPGDDSTLYAEVENTGDGVLTLYEPLAENCEDAFTFTPSWQFGDELGAGETASVAVTYAPEDIDGTVCGLLVATDDGDGYAEVHGDCDDDDPEAFPNADEICNDLDDDCDGTIDDDCIALTGPPLALTGVVATSTAVVIGGETTVSMVVLDEQALTWSWSSTDGTFADLTAENAVWTAPLTAGVYTLTGRALDEDNNEVWGFGDIEVVEEGDLDGIAIIDEEESTGCSTAPGAGLALFGLLAITRRR